MSHPNLKAVGAHFDPRRGTTFRVFSPNAKSVHIETKGPRLILPLKADGAGYFEGTSKKILEGTKYKISVDERDALPDPASRFQPDGVHGWSQVVSSRFKWRNNAFEGLTLDKLVIYELHIGTFTKSGTFAAAIADLPRLKNLGVSAIEIMPVAQFPGERNWGYDGVYPFAVQSSYGGPQGLKQLVDAAHGHGLGVILDVVYNHLGPEGNYFHNFGPYFNDEYRTPWGSAINFDGPYSSDIRAFFLQNARQWFEEFRIDGLRLDAVHAIHDEAATPFLEELVSLKQDLQHTLNKSLLLIAESDSNDSRLLRSQEEAHKGLDAQWNDDVHHTLHSLISGELFGYYKDFGKIEHVAKYLKDGVVYDGQYSQHRRRRHGRSYDGIDRQKLIVCVQNHDQIGNRPMGERFTTIVAEKRQRLAAALTILSPFTPMLFMGEEYGETAPFLYFADHSDPQIIKATREGRQREWGEAVGNTPLPDPFALNTFEKCKLREDRGESDSKAILTQSFYQKLLKVSIHLHKHKMWKSDAFVAEMLDNKVLKITMCRPKKCGCLFFSFNSKAQTLDVPKISQTWKIALTSQEDAWRWTSKSKGELTPFGVVVLLSF